MTEDDEKLFAWLLAGDVSIRYQVHRDLLGTDRPGLRKKIQTEGWGSRFLAARGTNGHWGRSFYQPKWISSHYTLLDLKHLQISQNIPEIQDTISIILDAPRSPDGGVFPISDRRSSDVCVNGMLLTYACYFGASEDELRSVIDFLMNEHMEDGGFNCNSNHPDGARHSSMHSTISVAEGFLEYESSGCSYRLGEIRRARRDSEEFLLQHRMFRSHRTGAIIDKKMLMLSFPSRWRYDILRCLDHFRRANATYDERMEDAFRVLLKKRRKDCRWPLQARHPGQTHFEMEKPGKPSRWNTLRAMRVLRHFGIEH